MKLKIYITICSLVTLFIPLYGAFAGDTGFEGEVTVKGELTDIDGSKAKFNEYTDIKDGIYGAIGLRYGNDNYFMRLNAYDIGWKTQKYTLDGEMWGKFKYNLYYDEIPHNITFGAKSVFAGVGGDSLTLRGDPNNASTWSSFDYETKRKRYGGGISMDFLSPFFLDISAQREDKKGVKPAGGGGFSGPFELPEPIDYTTDMFRIEGGYSKKPFFASLSYFYSKFENDNQALDFVYPTNPATTSSLTLPPDNKYYKVAFKGAVFLPYSSKLSLNVGTAQAKSDADANSILSLDAFNGKVDTNNFDVVFTSNPVSFLDGKLFYKYYDRDNKSEGDEDHLGYLNRSLGGQLGFKLPAHLRLTVGYTNGSTEYDDRFDATKRKDNDYSAELAWSGLDFAVFKIGYEQLHRSLVRNEEPNLWLFDVAPQNRYVYKASVDLDVIENLSVTVGYKNKTTHYESAGLGLKKDLRDEVYVDASYGLGKYADVYGYFDYEKVRFFQIGFHSSSGNWDLWQRERNYDYGIGTDIHIMPKKLTLKLQYDYGRSDGTADFNFLGAATPPGVDITNWDDYKLQAFSARAIYDVIKSVSVTAGYAYQRYKLDDIQFDGYQYIIGNARLTGAYKDPNYIANVVFLALTYKF